MIGMRRRNPAVLAGCDAGELEELAVEVRLIAVSRQDREIGPRPGLTCCHSGQSSLEPLDAAVELGRQANGFAEQPDKSPVAVAAIGHYFGDTGRFAEALECHGHSRVKTAYDLNPFNKERFE
jgi:hypothetical protein